MSNKNEAYFLQPPKIYTALSLLIRTSAYRQVEDENDGGVPLIRMSAYRQVEDENVGGVPHVPVHEDHQHHQQVPNEADDDDQGEEDRDHDGNDLRGQTEDINRRGEPTGYYTPGRLTPLWGIIPREYPREVDSPAGYYSPGRLIPGDMYSKVGSFTLGRWTP